jgi:hypothetical protein
MGGVGLEIGGGGMLEGGLALGRGGGEKVVVVVVVRRGKAGERGREMGVPGLVGRGRGEGSLHGWW